MGTDCALCVVKCCSVQDIRNTMDIAEGIYYFFDNSPKRMRVLLRKFMMAKN